MIQRIYRILFLLFVVAGAFRMSAQTRASDLGVSIVLPQLSETTISGDFEDISIDFDESTGYGISFNHFWTSAFSTEVALQKYTVDMEIGETGQPRFTVGELDITSWTALGQLHFNRNGRVSPYVGAGAAWMNGRFDPVDAEPDDEPIDLENELTWAASAGANFRLTDRVSIGGEVKYVEWDATEDGGSGDEAISLDPLTISLGVRFRF